MYFYHKLSNKNRLIRQHSFNLVMHSLMCESRSQYKKVISHFVIRYTVFDLLQMQKKIMEELY